MRLRAIALLAVAWAASGCRRESSEDLVQELTQAVAQSAPPEEQHFTVQRGDVTRRIQSSSSVAPVDEQKLYFRADGRIRAVYVQEDDWVKPGAVLAELEMSELAGRAAEAEVSLEIARARLVRIVGNERAVAEATGRLAIAEARLEQARAQDPVDEITIAQARLEQSRLAVVEARASQVGLRAAELDAQIAAGALEQARRGRVAHRLGLEILEAEVGLARLDLDRARIVDDESARSDLRLAEIALERAREQAEMSRIRAVRGGRVMSIAKVAGSEVRPYEPVIVVADPSALEIVADLPRADVIQLHVGQPAEIELSDTPGRVITGRIRRLPYAGLTGTDYLETVDRFTRIQFSPPADTRLEVGDPARATIVLAQAVNVLYLPPEALRVYQGRRFVVVLDGEQRRRVDIRVGVESTDRVEIADGLQEGQLVSAP